jgi:glutamate racemase
VETGGYNSLRASSLLAADMNPDLSTRPIGVFDSGIGGLTVARAVARVLPHERLVYFGDTAHLPYGDKSTAAIQAYSVKICDLLLKQQCKVILIACNSASAAAYELVREYVGSKARVLNVIDPIVAHVGQAYAGRTIGLIGTKQTVNSNVYRKKIDELDAGVQLQSLATPLLAPMIEEGFFDNSIAGNIIESYLTNPALEGIEALVLACTHYPLIKKQITDFYQGRTAVLDASDVVAAHVQHYLQQQNLAAQPGKASPVHHFYVSDFTRSFEESTRIFFGQEVHLEHYPLWE